MPERVCHTCTRQVEWGCDAIRLRTPDEGEPDDPSNWHKPSEMPLLVDDEETHACPARTLLDEPRAWNRLLKLYSFYKKGFLPDSGAVVHQSNALMEAFLVLDSVNSKCDDIEAEARRTKGNPLNRR